MDLASRLIKGDRSALARALGLVEDGGAAAEALLKAVMGHTGQAHRVGVTGAPGVGKSCLVAALIQEARRAERQVAVLAVDPTSPLSGGALLGDRIRMGAHGLDAGVFVRSMATRGLLGGLGRASGEALDLLDAAGFDLILVETAGAGQTDLDIVEEVETTLLVLAPGAGDGIQAMKSGLMELADLWVVNKGDDPRAQELRTWLLQAQSLRQQGLQDIEQRVVVVSAREGLGVAGLFELLQAELPRLEACGKRSSLRRRRIRQRIKQALLAEVQSRVERDLPTLEALVDAVLAGRCSAGTAARDLLPRLFPAGEPEPEERR